MRRERVPTHAAFGDLAVAVAAVAHVVDVDVVVGLGRAAATAAAELKHKAGLRPKLWVSSTRAKTFFMSAMKK